MPVSGRPSGQPMLFAHGFGCDQNMWRLVTPAFENEYRIITFDHVGAGGSDLSACSNDSARSNRRLVRASSPTRFKRRSSLPAPSQIPGLEIAASYRPAGHGDTVGGDFYDVFATTRGDWVVAVGDVSGKGVDAARVTAAARYTLRATAMRSTRPRVALSALNDALLAQDLGRYCTVACAQIPRVGDIVRITVCSGGHPLPLLVTAAGEVTAVGAAGMLLGALPRPRLEEATITMAPGDVMVFYTDGITEGRRGDEFFGEERMCDLLRRSRHETPAIIARTLVEEVLAFQDGSARDDIAVLVVRYPPES